MYWCFEMAKCATINDTNVLLDDLLTGYKRLVRPIADQDRPVFVNVSLVLKSIQQLDEVRGEFSFFAGINMNWIDAKMTWNPQSYGGIESIKASYEDVWVPELILMNPAEEANTLGMKWQTVLFLSNGLAYWIPGNLIKSTCTVDMTYYPFDTQICEVTFTVWGYSESEVALKAPILQADIKYYEGNNIWTFKNSIAEADGNSIDFLFYLERKSGFIIMHVLLPLTFLSILNAFVFLLVPESGERMSYCITVLLSIAVFMTIVSDTLPRSSKPIPMISYKLLFDLINSALITLITIFNMRIYNKKDTTKVPRWLRKLYQVLACKNQNGKIIPAASNDEQQHEKIDRSADNKTEKASLQINQGQENIEMDEASTNEVKISWEHISFMVDCYAFVIFALFSVLSFVLFLVSVQ
ncbi:neuronal acetylcholine receptor subunit alpha-2-like [Mercenaria mercenaria]|uniref:neuronal acetylcholine receptor subunit alpha-2-like n=1 Tax=Mercenaria mercenaria TaxID=6596 RepID=UPI00234EDF2C|nr:neuronal acetylcholine receptor subunit alpha-2-like [Mercenaria mercenaria]